MVEGASLLVTEVVWWMVMGVAWWVEDGVW